MTATEKHALVTGGAGFLGSAVCERLLAEGARVVCVDTLITGRRTNMTQFMDNSSFSFVHTDICSFEPSDRFDEIWNLASPASPPRYQAVPIETMMTNVAGTARMLDMAVRDGARFFQASTSEVYGDPTMHPQAETYRGNVNPVGPRACYDEGKRAAEALCYDYRRVHGTDVRVARIFNTYGPHMDPGDGRVVSSFIVSSLSRRPLEVYGDGSQTRTLCYRDDLVEGMFRLMRHAVPVEGPVNLGGPQETAIGALAELVLEMTGSAAGVVHKPLPADDPVRRCPDISLARDILGWKPETELRDGLQRTIDYFRNAIGDGYGLKG